MTQTTCLPPATFPIFSNLHAAAQAKYPIGVVDHAFQIFSQLSETVNYGGSVVNKVNSLSQMIDLSRVSAPLSKAAATISAWAQTHAFINFLGAVSLIGGALSLFSEGIGAYQNRDYIHRLQGVIDQKEGDPAEHFAKAFENVPFSHLKQMLPEYIQKELGFEGSNSFEDMRAKFTETHQRPLETKDIEQMKEAAHKKLILHILGMGAAMFGIITGIAMLATLPAAVVTAFTIASIVAAIALYVVKKGWVENPEKGVNLKRYLPDVGAPFNINIIKGAKKTELYANMAFQRH